MMSSPDETKVATQQGSKDIVSHDPVQTAAGFLARITKPQTILIAVSGGSDSLASLFAFHIANSDKQRHRLIAVTIDHALRTQSAAEAAFVADLCQPLGIEHHIRRWEGAKPATGLSAAARDARYHLMGQLAEEIGASMAVTGHTLDDQAETVAMRRARNMTVERGLAGMAEATLYRRHLWILRPFLQSKRSELRAFLDRLGITWIDDPSNDDLRFERVRLRKSGFIQTAERGSAAASHRQALAAQAADWLLTHGRIVSQVVATIPITALSPTSPATSLALAVLLAVIGGRPFLPQQDKVEALGIGFAKGEINRATLSRTLMVSTHDALWLVRERRGLLPLPLAGLSTGTFDQRFVVSNPHDQPVLVLPGPNPTPGADLPPAIRAAAMGSWPVIRVNSSTNQSDAACEAALCFPLFDQFLPDFDLPLADAIDEIFGRAPLPSSPF